MYVETWTKARVRNPRREESMTRAKDAVERTLMTTTRTTKTKTTMKVAAAAEVAARKPTSMRRRKSAAVFREPRFRWPLRMGKRQ